jgi:hypothetical protein
MNPQKKNTVMSVYNAELFDLVCSVLIVVNWLIFLRVKFQFW